MAGSKDSNMKFPKQDHEQWHTYFAWLPTTCVDSNGDLVKVWLENVERKLSYEDRGVSRQHRVIDKRGKLLTPDTSRRQIQIPIPD
jgi:hypothetical protein